MPHIKDFPTIFRLDGTELFRLDGLLPLADGTGVTVGDGEQYKVIDSWLNIEHNAEYEEGLFIDLRLT